MNTNNRVRAVLLAVLLAGLGTSVPASGRHQGLHIPEARVGDGASYAASGDGAVASFSFEWLPPSAVLDRWGGRLEADQLRMLVPGAEMRDETFQDIWVEVREAFDGSAQQVWRAQGKNEVRQEANEDYETPLFSLTLTSTRNITQHANLTTHRYDPAPWLRSCLAHNALQGAAIGISPYPLDRICPGLSARIQALPLTPRETTFLGRPAVEYRFRVQGGVPDLGDLPVHPGYLLLVVAEGIPYVAAAEARPDEGDERWRVVLDGWTVGRGPVVAPPSLASAPPERRDLGIQTTHLGYDGPPDGGSGLPYTLEEALASIRADPPDGYLSWRQDHPDGFVVEADLALPTEGQEMRYAWWTITLGDDAPDGRLDTFTVTSNRAWLPVPREAEGLGVPAPSYERNRVETPVETPRLQDLRAVRPSGEATMDMASALAMFSVHAPGEAAAGDLLRVAYHAPTVDGPPRLRVVRAASNSSAHELVRTSVVVDATTGAATEVGQYHRSSVFAEDMRPLGFDGYRPLDEEPQGLAVASLERPEVVGFTLAALVALVLAHAGYLTVAYSRLLQSDLLDHPVRRRIYDLVAEKPGIHFAGIAKAIGLRTGAAMYHLQVLEQGSLVTHVTLRKFKRYYTTGSTPFRAMQRLAELETKSSRILYDIVRQEPGITLSELARRLDVSVPAVHKIVGRLCEVGLLERRPDGRAVRLVAAPGALQN